jgi:hypothetical protein
MENKDAKLNTPIRQVIELKETTLQVLSNLSQEAKFHNEALEKLRNDEINIMKVIFEISNLDTKKIKGYKLEANKLIIDYDTI